MSLNKGLTMGGLRKLKRMNIELHPLEKLLKKGKCTVKHNNVYLRSNGELIYKGKECPKCKEVTYIPAQTFGNIDIDCGNCGTNVLKKGEKIND